MNLKSLIYVFLIFILGTYACNRKDETGTRTFYLNSISGDDSNDGLSPETAWKSLKRASEKEFTAGEKLLLGTGSVFKGKLVVKASGTRENPVVVDSYETDETGLPVIDGGGYTSAIRIENCKYITIKNIEITADAGTPKEPDAKTVRYGVYIEANEPGDYSNINLNGLKIHGIFATENIEIKEKGQNPTSNMGYGVYIGMKNGDARISNLKISDCHIERTGHTGIIISGAGDKTGISYLKNVEIINNHLKHIGGPGIVPRRCENVIVRGNITDHSGSSIDPRMHNRGSGMWPWNCNNVIIEKNKFMNAWGIKDSYGCHIDWGCNDVIVQYNLSVNNSGGFVEILGNNHNCCYRYNMSINDGYREKGVNGVVHDGKLLWTSGYSGSKQTRTGPINSYIYNNTIFVKEDYDTRFSFAPTTDGLLIANNIFYIMGESVDVKDNEKKEDGSIIQNVVFNNNLYQRAGIVPESVSIHDSEPLFGDPRFKNPGGMNPEDYIPNNVEIIKNKGIKIEKLPGDETGLKIGLDAQKDFFGNPIQDLPDLGAIEIQ